MRRILDNLTSIVSHVTCTCMYSLSLSSSHFLSRSKEKEIASLQQKTEEDANEITALQRKIRELQVGLCLKSHWNY